MSLILSDIEQIDPTKVWLRPPALPGDPYTLVDRRTGSCLGEEVPLTCGTLPRPFQAYRPDGKALLFRVADLDHSQGEAIALARGFGFRTNPIDIAEHGDPGYHPLPVLQGPVFAVGHWKGRTGDVPATLVRLTYRTRDENGFLTYDWFDAEEIEAALDLEPIDDDLFTTTQSVAQAIGALEAAGLQQWDELAACLPPERFYFSIQDNPDEPGHVICLRCTSPNYIDGELMESGLERIPDFFGPWLAGGLWAVKGRPHPGHLEQMLLAEGFVRDPAFPGA